MFIVMTFQQAAMIEGDSTAFARLNPVAIKGGLFVLGVDVLDDPNHASKRELLRTFPVRELAASEFANDGDL